MSDRDLWLARRLGQQLREDGASDLEIGEVVDAAFSRPEERSVAYSAAYLSAVGRRLRERAAAVEVDDDA